MWPGRTGEDLRDCAFGLSRNPAIDLLNDLRPGVGKQFNAGRAQSPQRIVSLNLCTDQLLMALVAPRAFLLIGGNQVVGSATSNGAGVWSITVDLPGLTQQGNIHVGEGMKTAWFKDPDGNILSLIEGGE